MFDDDDEGADVVEEDEAAASDDDAFVVAKPQVRVVLHISKLFVHFQAPNREAKVTIREFYLMRTT
jgi:hypothetical protein